MQGICGVCILYTAGHSATLLNSDVYRAQSDAAFIAMLPKLIPKRTINVKA